MNLPDYVYWFFGTILFLQVCKWSYKCGFKFANGLDAKHLVEPIKRTSLGQKNPFIENCFESTHRESGDREDLTNALTILTPEDCQKTHARIKSIIKLKRDIEMDLSSFSDQ